MNKSLAQTFSNLTNVAYTWRSGEQADATIPWHAVCGRGGNQIGATSPPDTKGAGDD